MIIGEKLIKILKTVGIILAIFFIFILGFKKYFMKPDFSENIIYACSINNGIYEIDSKNFSVIRETKIKNIFDIDITEDGVIFGIQNRIDPAYKEVFVFKDGKVKEYIPLTYTVMDKIKYNEYDKNMYVSQTSKITESQENCITVIDTKKLEESKNIMYEDYIHDFTFDDNGNIITVSSNIDGEFRIDMIDKDNEDIFKTIALEKKFNNIIYLNRKIYLSSNTNEIKVYDLDKEIWSEIILDHDYAYTMQIYENKIYITHSNEDDLTGKYISILDLSNDNIKTSLVSDDHNYNHYCMVLKNQNIITSNFKEGYILNNETNKKLKIKGVIKMVKN